MNRIQRKRTKGWRMPENTVYVGRPSQWGNPFDGEPEETVPKYREWLPKAILSGEVDIAPLFGKNLACWCSHENLCHADVLLEMAEKLEPLYRKSMAYSDSSLIFEKIRQICQSFS